LISGRKTEFILFYSTENIYDEKQELKFSGWQKKTKYIFLDSEYYSE
jgi:hypothetical protein